MNLSLECRAIANYIIEKINKFNNGKPLREQVIFSIKRLQKILYLCEIEYMKKNKGKPLFSDEFYAWPSGPIIVEVYHEFMQYQDGEIHPRYQKNEPTLSKDIKLIIEQILAATKDLDTSDLIKISNVPGGPHSKVFNEEDKEHNQIVSKKETYLYFSKQEIFPQLKQEEITNKTLYQNEKKTDIEAKLFMLILHLKEELQKVYSPEECNKNIAYVFNNYNEFKSYFLLNGFIDISDDLLELCRMKTTKKGKIIALKGLCDYAIRKHNISHSQIINSSVEEELILKKIKKPKT